MFNGLGIAAAMALTAVSAPAIAGDKEDGVPIAIPAARRPSTV